MTFIETTGKQAADKHLPTRIIYCIITLRSNDAKQQLPFSK